MNEWLSQIVNSIANQKKVAMSDLLDDYKNNCNNYS